MKPHTPDKLVEAPSQGSSDHPALGLEVANLFNGFHREQDLTEVACRIMRIIALTEEGGLPNWGKPPWGGRLT